jgi:hypothetical protein
MDIDALIAEKEREAQQLRYALARTEADLKAMRRTRAIARGETDSEAAARYSSKAGPSIPDLVEAVLKEEPGGLHVDLILARIKSDGIHVNLKKQTITSALSRWIDKEKRFKRTGRNTFALRDAE